MAKLLITLDGAQVGEIPVDKERISIGRRADNDIQLDHIAVSGQHAVVVSILNDSFLEDLGSTNGTLVNGAAVRKHFLRNGDLVEIGRHRLRYLGDQLAPREAADFEKTMVLNRPMAAAPATAVPAGVSSATVANLAPADSGRDVGGAIAALMESQVALQSHFALPSQPPAGLAMSSALAASPAAVPLVPSAIPVTATPAMTSPVAASSSLATAVTARSPAAAVPVTDAMQASLQVLSGSAAGRLLGIQKALTTIGRPGIQVAVISRRGDGYHLAQVEGEHPVVLNGQPVPAHAVPLTAHDVIEIAGIKLEFFFEGPGL